MNPLSNFVATVGLFVSMLVGLAMAGIAWFVVIVLVLLVLSSPLLILQSIRERRALKAQQEQDRRDPVGAADRKRSAELRQLDDVLWGIVHRVK